MKAGQILVALVGLLGAGCSMRVLQNACRTNTDCDSGQICVNRLCGRYDADAKNDGVAPVTASMDGAGGHHDASSDLPDASNGRVDSSSAGRDASADHQDGSIDGHDASRDRQDSSLDGADASSLRDGGADSTLPEPPPQASCDGGAVTECPAPATTARCEQVYCGGRLWRDGPYASTGFIPYRIKDPDGLFSDAYKDAIRASAMTWSQATRGLISFSECSTCTGRFISVVPGPGDGVNESPDWEQLLPLPVDSTAPGNIPWHRIGHQWGHAIGLDDMYRRPDRGLYTTFDPAVWCGNRTSLPATCASSGPTQQLGSPPIPSGTFGPYDELSLMNGLQSEGICGNGAADPNSAQPTLGDISAVEELYFGTTGPWAPFQPIARSTGVNQPLDYQLAPGIDPVGSPAIAEWTAPSIDIVVRGTDGNVYETWNDLAGTTFLDWADWRVVADHVDADPAMVFGGPTTLYLAVRSSLDGSIRLRTRTTGAWGAWLELGAPSVGAASAPAIVANDQHPPVIFVRGRDNFIYEVSPPANAWTALPAPPSPAGFVGKPAATWNGAGTDIFVSAVSGDDNQGWLIGGSGPADLGGWITVGVYASADDPDASIPMAGLEELDYVIRDPNGLLLSLLNGTNAVEIGGMPLSTPGVVGTLRGDRRVDIAALINDHRRPGVWWKFLSTQNTPPCNYNAPGTCAQCGCGFAGGPRCDL